MSIVQHIAAAIAAVKHETGVAPGAIQIFVSSPRRRAITLTPGERGELRAFLAHTPLRVFAHSSYVVSPWRGDPGAAAFIREELAVCAEAGISGLIVHLPRGPPALVVEFLPRLLPPPPGVTIFLETPAVVPSEAHYNTPEKLDALFAAIRAQVFRRDRRRPLEGKKPEGLLFFEKPSEARRADGTKNVAPRLEGIGLCVDTAHLWTSGVDLRSFRAAGRWLQGLEAIEAADLEVLFHLNDSACERGHGPDKHEALGHGKIWGPFLGEDHMAASGVAALVAHARLHRRAVILERAPRELIAGDFRVLRRLVFSPPAPKSGGRRLSPHQPGAQQAGVGAMQTLGAGGRTKACLVFLECIQECCLVLYVSSGSGNVAKAVKACTSFYDALRAPGSSLKIPPRMLVFLANADKSAVLPLEVLFAATPFLPDRLWADVRDYARLLFGMKRSVLAKNAFVVRVNRRDELSYLNDVPASLLALVLPNDRVRVLPRLFIDPSRGPDAWPETDELKS